MITIQPSDHHQSHLFTHWNRASEPAWIVVSKCSWRYQADGHVERLPQSEPLVLADEYTNNDPTCGGLTNACELAPFKTGSEILIYGHAVAEAPCRSLIVKAALNTDSGIQWQKKLQVFGPRTWQHSALGTTWSDAEELTELPIRYEYAFGGRHPKKENNVFEANPVGLGYAALTKAIGQPLPQIEFPNKLLSSPNQTPKPAGFGPIPAFWQPRAKQVPEVDEEKLLAGKYPFRSALPAQFYQSAPADQQFPEALAGACQLALTGMTRGTRAQETVNLQWHLPRLNLRMVRRNQTQHNTLTADTLIVDTARQQLHLLYRTALTGLPENVRADIYLHPEDITHD